MYSHWGILFGEAMLVLYLVSYMLRRKSIHLSSTGTLYYAFTIYFIFVSSVLSALVLWYLPVHSTLYIMRLMLYVALYLWAFEYYVKVNSDSEILDRVYNKPFVVHFIVSLIIMVAYYLTHSPTANEIMWGYEVGLRMIPLAGLIVDFDSFFFLKAISGSGNLLSGWALAILIINLNQGVGNFKKTIVILAVLTVLLTVSRGGFITMSLFLLYFFTKNLSLKVSPKTILVVLVFVGGLVTYFTFSKENPLPNIFDRLSITYEGGKFDGSTQGRLDNYIDLLESWISNPFFIIFGFGYDEVAVLLASRQTVVESFFLQVLFCSGLVGLVLLFGFYLFALLNRTRNFWYRVLWEFLIFQSIISWTVTGGDFFAPHATFLFMTFLGFAAADGRSQINSLKIPI